MIYELTFITFTAVMFILAGSHIKSAKMTYNTALKFHSEGMKKSYIRAAQLHIWVAGLSALLGIFAFFIH